MKKNLKTALTKKNLFTADSCSTEIKNRLLFASTHDETEVLQTLGTGTAGLNEEEVESAKKSFGSNIVMHKK
ncbi:MAG: hypothetical protein LKK58_03990, partial [Oscillospiraceae bacterium]|nr:hypothetical protein [Oscillospiraceae bacterium]